MVSCASIMPDRRIFVKVAPNGIGDHQVEWHNPKRRPAHMSADEFTTIPNTLMVREVSLRLSRKGFRDQVIIVVTTNHGCQMLHCQPINPSVWLALASGVQSTCVISLATLKMEMLTAKTPEMVRKEIWTHLLGYNLLRSVMEQAAPLLDYERTRLSLQGTRQHFNQTLALLATATNAARKRLYSHLLGDVVADRLPHRPNRQEPRVVKRRPKPFPRMRQPRSVLKAKLAA